jgi:hypothetical protein
MTRKFEISDRQTTDVFVVSRKKKGMTRRMVSCLAGSGLMSSCGIFYSSSDVGFLLEGRLSIIFF